MEYILNSEREGIDFDRYSAYVESIRSRLPTHVYAFASDPSYFEHTGHGELITHEIRLAQNGLLLHEFLFERGSTLLIKCPDNALRGNNLKTLASSDKPGSQ